MTVEPLSMLNSPMLQPGGMTPPAEDGFSAALRDAERAAAQGDEKTIRDAAEKLVASALVMPLLEQMRASAKQNDLFHGGSGEDLFAQQMDTQLADRIVSATRFPLVDAIHQQFQQFQQAAALGRELNAHG
jgi:Rod binding domain-containing protein